MIGGDLKGCPVGEHECWHMLISNLSDTHLPIW
jgi:hypothetical protein